MRITPETLSKIARDTVNQRIHNRSIIAAYLHGSLLRGDPLLAGTADIDLFFVHLSDVEQEREVVRLTDDVHLDIAHHLRSLYRQTKEIRLDPWLGYTVFECKILYDPQHFMDFTQASVRGQFHQPDNVYRRAQVQLDRARHTWMMYQLDPPSGGIPEITAYLQAIENAGNAIASLYGPPLPERRFLLHFAERAHSAGQPGLYAGLLGLLGAPAANSERFKQWLADWRVAYRAIPPAAAPVRLHPHRFHYYMRPFEAALEAGQPQTMLWPLLSTWTQAVASLGPDPAFLTPWQAALTDLELFGPAFSARIEALDAYLDHIEEVLEAWGQTNGVTLAD